MANWWGRHVVPRLIRCCCGQPAVMNARKQVIPLARGDVFELGCGGGINMPLYDFSGISSFAGIDPSAELLDFTRKTATEHGIAAAIRQGAGENLPYADASFDTVVTTFTLCSVQDPGRVLAELRRVLRPGGRALFLEHGRAPDLAVQRWQRRLEPIWTPIAGGCHLTRPISDAYAAAGFNIEPMGQRYMPKTPRPLGWIEWGVACH